jgi:hypothetical protein
MYIGLLPIGSVVKLNDETSYMMIVGYFAVTQNIPDHVWDYTAVVFPGGILDTTETYQFDKENIQEIIFIGFEDEEQNAFITRLNLKEPEIKRNVQNQSEKDEV